MTEFKPGDRVTFIGHDSTRFPGAWRFGSSAVVWGPVDHDETGYDGKTLVAGPSILIRFDDYNYGDGDRDARNAHRAAVSALEPVLTDEDVEAAKASIMGDPGPNPNIESGPAHREFSIEDAFRAGYEAGAGYAGMSVENGHINEFLVREALERWRDA